MTRKDSNSATLIQQWLRQARTRMHYWAGTTSSTHYSTSLQDPMSLSSIFSTLATVTPTETWHPKQLKIRKPTASVWKNWQICGQGENRKLQSYLSSWTLAILETGAYRWNIWLIATILLSSHLLNTINPALILWVEYFWLQFLILRKILPSIMPS